LQQACKVYREKIENRLKERHLTWGLLDKKYKYGYYAINMIKKEGVVSPFKLIQLSKLLDIDYHELADTSDVPEILLRRTLLGLTLKDVAEMVGCTVHYLNKVELGKESNPEFENEVDEALDELEGVDNDYTSRLISSVMRYSY